MGSPTGVLPFLRGADFSHNNFQEEKFPHSIDQMKGLRWLKLNRTRLNWIPEEFVGLNKLENLNLSHNNLISLHGELVCLNQLKFLNCRYNKINGSDVPVELFNIETLTVLDLSHNNLTVIPKGLENCKSLTVLNLGHNNLKNLSEQLFTQLIKLVHLDISDNQLKTIPPQIGRLSNLKTLILNNNPLEEHKMRQLERLKSLTSLQLANTQRNANNTPPNLSELSNLVELNLSSNKLVRIPDDLSYLQNLRRLNLSENLLEKMPDDFGSWWPNLEILNLSGNKLSEISPTLCKLCNLKRLYLNDNELTFEGLPAALGKLYQLEVFMAARNRLELIPESIFRCGRLKKLILTSNRLITLPDTIHLLFDLEILELSHNPDLMMPPKPLNESARNNEFYNIDFSLNTQLRLAGDPALARLPPQQPETVNNPIARKLRLRKRARDDVDKEQEKNQARVLQGMRDLALERDNLANNQSDFLEPNLRPRRWDESLERPPIDYSEFFDETTGQLQGLTIWEIENFCPVLMEPSLYGKFYDADCYIVLSTQIDENLSLNWKIFYWIGADCTLDKKACSAIHAVGLRNHLNAQCRTIREEQGEESDEFLSLFPDGIDYVKGARTSSGFFTVEEIEYAHRMFRLHEVVEKNRQLHLETVALSSNSLDSRFVFLIDAGYKIFIWNGMKSKNTTKQKARLFGEMLSKEERKNKAELIFCDQGDEPPELLNELELTDALPKVPFKTIDLTDDFELDCYQPLRPVLYQIILGMGYIELIQVDFKPGRLSAKLLVSTNVYILDCYTDVFVWLGRKSSRLARNAALKLAEELFSMLNRPKFASVSSCLQGTESQLLKTKFKDWDDVIAVDYTRTAESVSKTGANLAKWMSEQKVKIDLAPLFAPRPAKLTEEESQILIDCWNDELTRIDTLVLEKGRGFVKLPEEEFGHFYTDDCYVFICHYRVQEEDLASSDDNLAIDDGEKKLSKESDEKRLPNGVVNGNGNNDMQSYKEDDLERVVYFWQGRQASKMGWLTFTFSLQKKLEAWHNKKLEVIHMHQQQENLKFISHFEQQFIIHQGKRKSESPVKPVALYHLRSNNNPLTLRCIEIEADSSRLNSGFCFIVRKLAIPFANGTSDNQIADKSYSAKIYVWVGSQSNPKEAALAKEIAMDKFKLSKSDPVITLREGEESDEFWSVLGGRQEYDNDASFMQHLRLFRCSNDKGYFSVSEKCTDFCQDDLSDDDIMILDNGSQVFLWIGPKSSEVEVKLAYKSAQVYVQNLRLRDPPNQRQLMLTFKGKESRKFTKCFHAWSSHKTLKDPRGDEAKYLRQAFQNDLATSQA